MYIVMSTLEHKTVSLVSDNAVSGAVVPAEETQRLTSVPSLD